MGLLYDSEAAQDKEAFPGLNIDDKQLVSLSDAASVGGVGILNFDSVYSPFEDDAASEVNFHRYGIGKMNLIL